MRTIPLIKLSNFIKRKTTSHTIARQMLFTRAFRNTRVANRLNRPVFIIIDIQVF